MKDHLHHQTLKRKKEKKKKKKKKRNIPIATAKVLNESELFIINIQKLLEEKFKLLRKIHNK